jgi:hypothetical protein
MKGRKTLRRAGIFFAFVALLSAGMLASGALGMTLDGGTSTDSSSTATDTASPPDSTSTDATSTDTTATTTTATTTTTTGSSSTSSPSIRSDQEDYNPGATVILTGASWGPGESVHIIVNDDKLQPWSYTTDASADQSGVFAVQFQLPSSFAATYFVQATGSSGVVATTTFTDGNVNVKAVGTSPIPVTWARFSNGTCQGGAGQPIATSSISATSAGNGTAIPSGAGAGESLRLTAGSVAGFSFTNWSNGDFTPANDPSSANPVCLVGNNSTQNISLTYVAVTDTTPPVITPVVTPASPNGSNGWYKTGNITVSFTVTDGQSTITSRSASCLTDATTTTVSTDGTTSITCTATSGGGTSSNTQTIKRDTTIPSIAIDASVPTSTTSSTLNVTGTASDATSGVAGVTVNGNSATYNAIGGTYSKSVTLVCGSNTISAVSTDQAGNLSSTAQKTVNYICDTTAPVITKTITGTAGNSGWYTSNVTVDWTVTDPDSAVVIDSGCGTQNFTTETAGTTSSCSAHSVGGSSSDSVTIKIDKTAPTISDLGPTPASPNGSNGWYTTDVSNAFAATDSGSGLSAGCIASFPLAGGLNTQSKITSGEGTSRTVTSDGCTDVAGNAVAGKASAAFKVDKTAPTISDLGPTPAAPNGSNGWYTTDVSNAFEASDATSGLSSSCVGNFPLTSGQNRQSKSTSGDGTGKTVTSDACTDAAGNSASGKTSASFKVDNTAPINVATTLDRVADHNGWYNASVGWTTTGTDATSTIDTCSTGTYSGPDGTGLTVSGHCTDQAGNSSANVASAAFKYDNTDPTLSPSISPLPILLNGSATASPGASDNLSGVDGGNTGCDPVVTSSVGSKTLQCHAADNAGNTNTKSLAYSVGFQFSGLFAPIDKPNIMNVSKAGQAIPLKWRLLDANGVPVTTLTSVIVKVTDMSCSLGATTDLIEEYAAGASGLQNLGNGNYLFAWKTPTSYVNSCKSVGLDLGEGSVRTPLAYITFSK